MAADQKKQDMQGEKEKTVQEVPRNRKQIGEIEKRCKIYIEDYVVTYLNQLAADKKKAPGVAGLFGTCREADGCKEYFIYGAAFEEGNEGSGKISRENVQKLMRLRAEHFPEHFFLGWCMVLDGENGTIWEDFYRSRLDTFFGMPEILFTIDKKTGENRFYTYPTEMPREMKGYFIFYEQNRYMQDFLVESHQAKPEPEREEKDGVAESCRAFYDERKARIIRNRVTGFACGALVLLVLFAMGSKMFTAVETGNVVQGEAESSADGQTEDIGVDIVLADISEDASEIASGEETGDSFETDSEKDNEDRSGIASQEEREDSTEAGSGDANEDIAGIEAGSETSSGDENVSKKEETVPAASVAEEDKQAGNKEKNPAKETVSDANYATYVVAKGDTLYGICLSFYGDLELFDEIIELNKIKNENNILCGQKILLPKQNL